MINKDVLLTEIKDAHTLYYSIRNKEDSTFDINLDALDSMDDRQLVQMLGLLNSLVKSEATTH
jgi:hypothetical protein